MSTRGGVQNCRTRDAAQTSHSQLNEIIDSNAGTNEQHNDIINESTNSSEQQQYVSITTVTRKNQMQISTSQKHQHLMKILEVITGVVMRLRIIPGQKTIQL